MPAIRRATKQFLYGGLFVGVLFLLFSVLIFPRLNIFGRTPASPPPPEREAIVIESVDPVVHGETVDIVARIRNPNPKAGVPAYSILFVLLDENDQEIDRITKETYLLPGSLNYIAAIDIPLTSAFARVRVESSDQPVFAELPQNISAPTFNSFLRSRQTKNIGDVAIEEQKGVVTNTSTLGYQHVDITGVALDSTGAVVGIGTTFIGQFVVGEQREFTLQWPAPRTATERVIVLPATNVYERDNILKVIGDPSRLREQPPTDEQVQGETNSQEN